MSNKPNAHTIYVFLSFYRQLPLPIQLLNNWLVYGLGLESLQLHSICKNLFVSKWRTLQVNVLCLLETVQAFLFSTSKQLFYQNLSNLFAFTKLFVTSTQIVIICNGHQILFPRLYDGYAEVLSWLTMHEYLFNKGTSRVNVLNFLGRYILALLQLKNIFSSIDNPQSITIGYQNTDISCFKPAITGYSLISFVLELVISWNNTGSSQPNLTSGGWSPLLVFVFACVFHLWNVAKFKFEIWLNNKLITKIPPTWPALGSSINLTKAAPVF